MPLLTDFAVPPMVLGAAELTHLAYAGRSVAEVLAQADAFHDALDSGIAARLFDSALAWQLAFRREDALRLQAEALSRMVLYRVASTRARSLRVLAICGPGDLMANTPLDFLTRSLDVRLDLLHLLPGEALPAAIPDHDVAVFACAEADPPMLARLTALFEAWPRPALNDPRVLPGMARDALSRSLAGVPGICSPTTIAVTREALLNRRPVPGFENGPYPCLLRPIGSHAGQDLARLADEAELDAYLAASTEQRFFLSRFVDYAGADGLYRKLRIAFVGGAPFLCHMAVSGHWMVHYLNAGMTEAAWKRLEEAEAMASFDAGFARRHAPAFAALQARIGCDLWSIDCAELPDGRLLVFEVDTAAILHLMDPGDLFPYKPPQMRRVFASFDALLRRKAVMPAPAAP